jgi:hypothetical protein
MKKRFDLLVHDYRLESDRLSSSFRIINSMVEKIYYNSPLKALSRIEGRSALNSAAVSACNFFKSSTFVFTFASFSCVDIGGRGIW